MVAGPGKVIPVGVVVAPDVKSCDVMSCFNGAWVVTWSKMRSNMRLASSVGLIVLVL